MKRYCDRTLPETAKDFGVGSNSTVINSNLTPGGYSDPGIQDPNKAATLTQLSCD